MLKRALGVSVIIGVAAALLSNCGGSSTTPPAPGNGTLASFVGDSPLCDVLAFRATISGVTVTHAGASNTTNVLNPNTTSIKVEFASLRDFSTILNFAAIPAGSYDKMTFSLSFAQIVVYDPTQSPPIRTVTVTLSNNKPVVPISPALTVTANKVSAVQVDFNLRQSIQLDSTGQVTGAVTPALTVTPVVAAGSQGFGEMDDVQGFVTRVDTFSSNTSFTGDFALQLLGGGSGGQPSVVVDLTSNTTLCGPAPATDQACAPLPLNQLLTGSFAEVDGFLDSNGNFVANTAEIEDQEVVENNQIALLGYVISVTRDASGNLTQFSFYVREEQPDDEFGITLDNVVDVNVTSSTIYQYSSRSTNSASLPFDSTSINVGQELVVHGVFTKPPTPPAGQTAPPTTVAPDRIYLKLQTDDGNFASLIQAGSDDKAGAFNFTPCATMFQGAPMMVVTSSQTTFVNVAGLNELTAQHSLLVKGLLFFEPQATTVNGVSVPAGTWVMLAKQVHQLI
ncbi:MAG TPA: DUF4382 domain-containing protein [Terriglobia bacterium]|nr:DUF4382 domain-containing protein [Terriglobia bacterium]